MDGGGALAQLIGARSVAIVGASERPGASSGFVMRNLLARGYAGRIVPVHLSAPTVFGLPAARSLSDLQDKPDAILVGLPAEAATGVIEEAGSLGIRAAVVLASGFAETGAEGAERQDALVAAARRHGMALCGPNCLGLFNNATGLALYSSRLPPVPRGPVAVLSHSGAMGIAFAHSGRIGVSLMVSAGNAPVTDMPDYLAHLADDPGTQVALLVVEAVRDPQAWTAALERMHAAGKPVVVLRAGRSEVGARASAAHTGALAGSDAAFVAFFRRIGAILVDDGAQALETAVLLSSTAGRRRGRGEPSGLALVGVSGGGLAHASDLASAAGLALPSLAPSTVDGLRDLLPGFATPQNPLDLTGLPFADPSVYETALRLVAADPAIGAIAAVQDVPAGLDANGAAEYAGIASALGAFARSTDIPVAAVTQVPEQHPDFAGGAGEVLPILRGLRPGLGALASLLEPPLPAVVTPPAPILPEKAWVERLAAGPLTEREAKQFLARHGLPVPREDLATTVEEAVAAARGIGFPVAMKIESADILHKTEAGGVVLGVADEDGVRQAFVQIVQSVATWAPNARIAGVLVQEMVTGGIEMLVGVTRHPTFGPVLAIGPGGVLVELLRDVAVSPLPVDPGIVAGMIERTRLSALLAGFRGAPEADRDAAIAAVARVAAIAAAYADVAGTLEINPLVVLPRGRGVRVVDALITA
ncbi:acetate--CoA ligase family protein [uncultured Alsobacter sp.]|uniref:acetate--CoA ligase family protein n=1 Tax=uncultured Alsobacter sp. TaxID=1748258 RepID=UPI0025DA24E6|nr:acetate--CoA ligase family protein [uncultured Alsobacter sp.]